MFSGSGLMTPAKLAVGAFAVGGLLIVMVFLAIAQGSGVITSYDDAFGVSSATGGATGDVEYDSSDPEARAFLNVLPGLKTVFKLKENLLMLFMFRQFMLY